MPDPYYPPLSRLIDARAIPGEFQGLEDFAQDGINLVLGKVFYKDLETDVSEDGSERNYSLTVLTREIKLPLFGSGMNLVFFRGQTTNFAEFPIILDWRWELFAYLSQLGDEGFSALPEAFVDALLDLADIDEPQEFIGDIVSVFLLNDPTAYQTLISALISQVSALSTGDPQVVAEVSNITTRLGAISMELDALLTTTNFYRIDRIAENYQDNPALLQNIEAIGASLDKLAEEHDLEIDYVPVLAVAALGTLGDIDEKFEKLLRLFESWFDNITKQDLYRLLVPHFSLSIDNINAALEFPRSWLVPAKESPANSGTWIEEPDQTKLAALTFDIGAVKLSSETGFQFENQSSFTFPPAMIGSTGIMLEFTGLEVDLSSSENIEEATADNRPDDFTGVYAERAAVTLPAHWFKDQDNTNAEIFGEKLLIGTGGVSGKIGLRGKGGDNKFWARFGGSDGFQLGFEKFDITLRQNKFVSSEIVGALKIAKFVYPTGHAKAGQPVEVGVKGSFQDDGDFSLTASAKPKFPIEFADIFVYHIQSLQVGREDDKVYLGTSGSLEFKGFLKDVLKLKAIDIEKMRINSDGSFEVEGGSIALAAPVVLPLGPVEITVTAMHCGSHQREIGGVMRKFSYFGFDGGVSVDPLGVEVRGDGVKFYFCTDDLPNPPAPYLHIQTLHLDLTIPASSPEVILKGWVSVPEPGTSKEYAGGIKLQIPKAKIAGSADMKLAPRHPAFIVDASIELPAPIPLGPVAIYGFRGLVGYRYVATKEAAGLTSGQHSWYDYYKKPTRGIHVDKFLTPDRTKDIGTPFSLGAGASLGTTADNGTTLNLKAMLLLSIPSLFMLDGRLAVLSARLGLDSPDDPPFFAFIAVGDNSLEFGFGADFKLPSKSGDIVNLYAEVQAAFFFNDSSRWYVNFGTEKNPTTATILRILTLKSYLMLSAQGIKAGGRGELNFRRSYGPIRVAAWAAIELGGRVSFERPQIGGYVAARVGADIDIKIVSLYAAFDVLLGAEAPKPFRLYGEFGLCVKIKIMWVFKFEFCGRLALAWEFDNAVDRTPIDPMIAGQPASTVEGLVKGVNMLSNETFPLAYLGNAIPGTLTDEIRRKILPLDTYIDFKSVKGLDPTALRGRLGGATNPGTKYVDLIPPRKTMRGKQVTQVKHRYIATGLEIKAWNPAQNQWQDYHPWKAVDPSNAALDALYPGQFQKVDGQYNTIRLLATSPFAFAEQGEPGSHMPEEYGLTPGELFCSAELREERCANFLQKELGTRYHCPDDNHLFYAYEAAFFVMDHEEPEEFAEIVSEANSFGFDQSLWFDNSDRLQIRLPQASVEVGLKLSSDAARVAVKYFATLNDDDSSNILYGNPDPNAANPSQPHVVEIAQADLDQAIAYQHPDWLPVIRIEVDPITKHEPAIRALRTRIEEITHRNSLVALGLLDGERRPVDKLRDELEVLEREDCVADLTVVAAGGFFNAYPKLKAGAGKVTLVNEFNAPMVYGLRQTDHPALFMKMQADGSMLWVKSWTGPDLEFRQMVQLKRGGKVFNIASAIDGKHLILVCTDKDGQMRWTRRIETVSPTSHIELLASLDEKSAYLAYSDFEFDKGHYAPFVLQFDIAGDVLASRVFHFDELESYGLILQAATLHEEGLALALQLSPEGGGEPGVEPALLEPHVAVLADLSAGLKVLTVTLFHDMLVRDIAVTTAGQFVLPHLTAPDSNLYLLAFERNHEPLRIQIEKSAGSETVIEAAEEGFYLSIWSKEFARVHHFTDPQTILWTKSIQYPEGEMPVDGLDYRQDLGLLAFTGPTEPVLGLSEGTFETCKTERKEPPRLKLDDLRFSQLGAVSRAFDVATGDIEGKWRDDDVDTEPICPPTDLPQRRCGTRLHEVCWLSLEDHEYNIQVPGQDVIADDTQKTIAAMTGHIQPIWRPDTSYCVRVSLRDEVDNNSQPAGSYAYTFGFTTAGPVGYFHTHPDADYGADPDQAPLTSLRQYIDYNRSYPNADGNLLAAKPLFYDSEITRIDLYFQKPWAQLFFHSWPAYNGLPARQGRIKIVIKDPAEGTSIINPPYLDYDPANTTTTHIPQTIESWQDDPDPLIPPIYEQYQHLLESQECVLHGGEIIRPPATYLNVVPKHLKPSKLYTALVNNLYDSDGDGDFDAVSETREVHKFTFTTSRYKDFADQVTSYLVTEGEGADQVTRPAIYSVEQDFSPTTAIAAYAHMAGLPNALTKRLEGRYQHKFDLLLDGIMKLPPLPPAQTTEFNLLRNAADGKIIAVLIRNPEPFNNPKIPLDEVADTIAVVDQAGTPASGYKVLHSKDYSQAIIMHFSLAITGPWHLRFQYKMWDGSHYIVPGTPDFSSDEVGTIIVNDLSFDGV